MKFAIKSKYVFNNNTGMSTKVYYVTREVFRPKTWWRKERTDSYYCCYDDYEYECNNKLIAYNNEGTKDFDLTLNADKNIYLPTYELAKKFLDHMVLRNQSFDLAKNTKPETLCYVELGNTSDKLKTVKDLIAGFDELTKQELINSIK